MFGEAVVEQTLSIFWGNMYAPLLASLFLLFSNETHFMKGFLKKKKTLLRSLNFTIRHIDDVLSLHNSKLVTMFNNTSIKLSLK